ncbi:MAG: hypothetical protein U9Q21_02600 [Candidatus Auribacterota bacterium]|nr:hypothetical protein [Candidatus Auribacterota bacterium]
MSGKVKMVKPKQLIFWQGTTYRAGDILPADYESEKEKPKKAEKPVREPEK